MKKILSILLFSLYFLSPALAQDFKYAWIISPTIGIAGADTALANIVDDINLNKDINFVIVSGNLTAKGSSGELDTVKTLLGRLNVPYHVIPGENDLRWSQDAGLKLDTLFKKGRFNFNFDSTRFIGLNGTILWRGGGGHLPPGEINWLSKSLSGIDKNQEIFIYSGFPFNDKLDNWFKAADILSLYNTTCLFAANEKPNTVESIGGVTTVSGLPAMVKGKFAYNVIENKVDSLSIYSVKNGITELWTTIAKSRNQLKRSDRKQFINYSDNAGKDLPSLKADVQWQADLNTTTLTDLYIASDKIISTSYNGTITCFDTTGKKLWKYDSKEKIVSTPVSDGKLLIAATLQGDLISLDINTGDVIQIIGIGEPLTSQLVKTDLVYNGSPTTGVIVATAGGKLYCYDIYSFELIWENDSAGGLVRSKPLLFNHRLYFGSQDGFLYCVDARTGALTWKWTDDNDFYTSPVVCQPVTDGNYIYLATPDKYVYKIDILLGVTKWKKDYNAWESINISSDKKYIIIKSISDKIYFAYTKNGRRHKALNLDFGFDLNPSKPLEWKGDFIFGTEKGKVYLIDKNFKWKALFFAGNARLNLIKHVKDNIFAVSNTDGKIICFEIK